MRLLVDAVLVKQWAARGVQNAKPATTYAHNATRHREDPQRLRGGYDTLDRECRTSLLLGDDDGFQVVLASCYQAPSEHVVVRNGWQSPLRCGPRERAVVGRRSPLHRAGGRTG